MNIVRLRERLEFITLNQQHHDQGIWAQQIGDSECGTFACLAGWTALKYGKDQLIMVKSYSYADERPVFAFEPRDDEWESLGAELLDMDDETASELFRSDNTLWDLWHIANIITNGQIEIPEVVEQSRNIESDRTNDYYVIESLRELGD